MRILGVDPGTLDVGYGCVLVEGKSLAPVRHGTVRAREKDFPARLRTIFRGLTGLLDEIRPDIVVVEEVFFARNARSAIRIGEGRAVAILCAALREVPVVEYSANEVKLAVAGTGHAHKTQILEMVKTLLGLREPPDSEHAADSLALAICHAHRLGRPELLPRARRGRRRIVDLSEVRALGQAAVPVQRAQVRAPEKGDDTSPKEGPR